MMRPLRARPLLPLLAGALLAAAASGAATANDVNVRLHGHVAERCEVRLRAASAPSVGALQGDVATLCNTRHRLPLRYAPELGRATGDFAGLTVDGDNGEIVLAASAAPSIGSTPLSLTFSNADAAPESATVQLVVAPLGL